MIDIALHMRYHKAVWRTAAVRLTERRMYGNYDETLWKDSKG